jgi:hypothetical protein
MWVSQMHLCAQVSQRPQTPRHRCGYGYAADIPRVPRTENRHESISVYTLCNSQKIPSRSHTFSNTWKPGVPPRCRVHTPGPPVTPHEPCAGTCMDGGGGETSGVVWGVRSATHLARLFVYVYVAHKVVVEVEGAAA